MGTKTENAAKRELKADKIAEQLTAWSTALDDLVAGTIKAGASSFDDYRVRLDGMRSMVGAVQAKLDEFRGPSRHGEGWGAFQADIKEDMSALTAGFEDLTQPVADK